MKDMKTKIIIGHLDTLSGIEDFNKELEEFVSSHNIFSVSMLTMGNFGERGRAYIFYTSEER